MFRYSFFVFLVAYTGAVQFQIKNNAGGVLWIGIQGNPGHAHLRDGGFVLEKGKQENVNAPNNWAGRFWARTWCDGGSKHCQTGDCGNKIQCRGAGGNPPATLAEITCKGDRGLDYYDISVVDGYNTRVSIAPQGGQGDGSALSCKKANCGTDINAKCPSELQQKGSNGQVIGCKSACEAFNTDAYCCRGAHNTLKTCSAKDWPKDYPAMFRKWCPGAYSYAYDDKKALYTCKNVPVYRIEFS